MITDIHLIFPILQTSLEEPVAQQVRHKNEPAITWLRALAMGGFTLIGLTPMNVHPQWLIAAAALTVGVLSLASAEVGTLAALVALSVPVIAAQPIVGMSVLVTGIILVRYLGADGGQVFLILALALAGAQLGIAWAAVALAGYFLGAGEGALAAALACVAVEMVGVALGRPGIGVTVSSGPARALVDFSHSPANLLGPEWFKAAIGGMGTKTVDFALAGISHIGEPAALVIQPALWAAGAGLTGWLHSIARRGESLGRDLVVISAGVALPAAGSVVMRSILKLPQDWSVLGITAIASLAVASGAVYVWERRLSVKAPAPSAPRVTMTAEDADVDDLLRLIATAEDRLAAQHTTTGIVMITDMKSFSRMTEEDGSIATAKAIQRHRDLLIPIIERHRGHGKSTGGDGLVASFESGSAALAAASEMQSALAARNQAHPDEREVSVRIGLASGEVVHDRGGRPFIGAALNLAARAMNLADGGQIFVTEGIATASERNGVRLHSFGKFDLKNIAGPVEILEVLWAAGQQARDPRSEATTEA